MERIWFLFSGGDVSLVSMLMDTFETSGVVQVPEDLQKKVGGSF